MCVCRPEATPHTQLARRSKMRLDTMERIVAMGGGGFSMEPRNPRLDAWILGLLRKPRPRVVFVPTASGDSPRYVRKFYRAFSRLRCQPSHLELFNREVSDLRKFVLSQDIVYVGGGNTASMMAVWRAHGLDSILGEAWRRGILLCGISAGAICWFAAGVTDSFGPRLHPFHDGLGLLPGSFCPHYDGEPKRRPAFHRLVASGSIPSGYAADDGAALLFEGQQLAEVVASRPRARGYRVERISERVREIELPTKVLDRLPGRK
jgi:dipeptidase E